MKKRFFASLLVVFTVFASLLPSTVSADSENQYNLDAKLNFQRGYVEVKETVNFTNRTLKDLNSVVFNVTPAHFHAFNLKTATIDGTPVDAKMDDVVMELPLPKPLAKRQTAQIQMEFTLDIPQQGGRFGINEHVITLGNWFPILAVYRDRDGWDRHKYNNFGDPFFTEAANYEVNLDVSAEVKVAHSGELVSHEGQTWQMKGTKIRDFALAISDHYVTKTNEVNGVTITTYYIPEHAPAGAMFMDVGVQAVQFLTKKLGPWPYKKLDIAEAVSSSTEMVGQEYPEMVYISSSMADKASGMKSPLGYLVAHEIVHQWFYSAVGNDQMYDPWMDEAMATYLGYQMLEMAPLTANSPSVVGAGSSTVDESIYDFRDEGSYAAATYGRGAMFLQDLNAALGSDNYYKMLKHYVEVYKDKIATPRNFFSEAQAFSTTDLNPLIRKYFSYPEFKGDATPKFEVKWPTEESWTGKINVGYEAIGPVQQVIVDADGRVLLTQDNPSSPLSVDISQLENDDYVVHVTMKDDNGKYSQQSHRAKITNPRPTPVPKVEPKVQPKNTSTDVVAEVSNIAKSVGSVDVGGIIVYGGIGLSGLVLLVLIGVAIRFITDRSPSVKVEQKPAFQRRAGNDRILEVKPMQSMQSDTPPFGSRPQSPPPARPSFARTPTPFEPGQMPMHQVPMGQPPMASSPMPANDPLPWSHSPSPFQTNPTPRQIDPTPMTSSPAPAPNDAAPWSRNPSPIPPLREVRPDSDTYGACGIGELEELETSTRNERAAVDKKQSGAAKPRGQEDGDKDRGVPFLGDFWPNNKK